METIECRCKKSKVIFHCVGQDLFAQVLDNVKMIENDSGLLFYYCKEYNQLIITANKSIIMETKNNNDSNI